VWSSTNPYDPRPVEIDEELRRVRVFDVTEADLVEG
jgi:hypothetical protein